MKSVLVCFLCLFTVTGQAGIVSRLDKGESLTISAIGTSETAMSPWFSQMGAWLNTKYPGKVILDNEAISGSNSTSGISTQLPAALAHNPDAVFIEFAINDCGQDAATHTNTMTLEQSKANLQTMINTIRSWATSQQKTIDIVIQTTNNDPWSTYRPDLPAYYQGYCDVAAENGLLLIDHYPNWMNVFNSEADHATWKAYVPDDIHPGPLGVEKVMLPEIQRTLTSHVPEPDALIMTATALFGLLAYGWQKRS